MRLFALIYVEFGDIKFVLATNHVSNIKKFIDREFDGVFDKVYISADIDANKPNIGFFEYILRDQNIKAENLLFVDDNNENILGAKKLKINTLYYTKNVYFYEEINKILSQNNI